MWLQGRILKKIITNNKKFPPITSNNFQKWLHYFRSSIEVWNAAFKHFPNQFSSHDFFPLDNFPPRFFPLEDFPPWLLPQFICLLGWSISKCSVANCFDHVWPINISQWFGKVFVDMACLYIHRSTTAKFPRSFCLWYGKLWPVNTSFPGFLFEI